MDIVDWLVEHPDALDLIEKLAEQVGAACDELFAKSPGPRDQLRYRLGDHFWCDVIAALVAAIDEVFKELDKIPEVVSKEVMKSLVVATSQKVLSERRRSTDATPASRTTKRKRLPRREQDREAGLTDTVVRMAVENLVRRLLAVIIESGHTLLDPTLLKLRVLGILLCPDCFAHRAVWDHCVLPLINGCVIMKTKEQLQEVAHLFDLMNQTWGLDLAEATSSSGGPARRVR